MAGSRIHTPGGTPGSLSNVPDQIRKMLGMGARDKPSRVYDRTSAQFYHRLVEYFFQSRERWESCWRVAEQEYNVGKWRDERIYDVDELKPARAYSVVATIESMVLANRPKFFLSGFTATDTEGAVPVFEKALNNEWRDDFKLVGEMRLCVRDAAKYGVGVMMSSYDAEYELETEEADESAEAIRQLHADDPVLSAAASEVESELAKQAMLEGPEALRETFEGDSRAVYNKVISRRISPWDFLIDPDCTSLDDAKWVGRIIVADLESVKADSMLKNTDGLKATGAMDKRGRFQNRDRNPNQDHLSPYELIHLYELFIRRPSGRWDLVLMAEGSDDFLRHEKDMYWIGCPYKALRWNQDGETFFCQSDLQLVLSEIVAERLLFTKVFDGYAREHSDTTFYSERLGISEEELNAAGDPITGKYVKVADSKLRERMPLQNYFFKIPKDVKSPESINLLGMLERAMQVSAGLGPNQFGQALKSGTTATEAAEVGSYVKGRGANKFAAVEEFAALVAKDRMGLMAQFYDAADIGRLAGQDAADIWSTIDWTRADVQHGLSISVEPGSTRATSEEGRINQLTTFIATIMQNPAVTAMFDLPAMFLELFRLYGFHDGSKFLQTLDGNEAGNMIAEFQALTGATGGKGGSPPAVPGATGAQAMGGAV